MIVCSESQVCVSFFSTARSSTLEQKAVTKLFLMAPSSTLEQKAVENVFLNRSQYCDLQNNWNTLRRGSVVNWYQKPLKCSNYFASRSSTLEQKAIKKLLWYPQLFRKSEYVYVWYFTSGFLSYELYNMYVHMHLYIYIHL